MNTGGEEQRVTSCAECECWIPMGEIMFPVYWSVSSHSQMNFICRECMRGYLREPIVPGGRI
jgi:hypothetical protein